MSYYWITIPPNRFTCVQQFDFYYVDIPGPTITPGEPLSNLHHVHKNLLHEEGVRNIKN